MNRDEETLEAAKQVSGTLELANLDFEDERRDGKAEMPELINVLQAILLLTKQAKQP